MSVVDRYIGFNNKCIVLVVWITGKLGIRERKSSVHDDVS